MKIAFSGPQASGKSTIIKNLLDNHLNKNDYTFIKGGARKIKDMGFEINEKGTDLSQILLFNSYIDDLVVKPKQYKTKHFIYDRWLMDGVVYSEWSTSIGKNKPWVFDYGLLMMRMLYTEIDVVFYCDPNGIPVENDNYRNVDLEYRTVITSIFENYIHPQQPVVNFKKLVRLTGNLQDRTAKVLKEI